MSDEYDVVAVEETVTVEEQSSRFEMFAGVVIAIFTAFLAINGLAGDSYGSSILIANGEKASAYDWYNSKSIKQILVEENRATLDGLVSAGAVSSGASSVLAEHISDLDTRIEKYQKEKTEILKGSNTIGEADWVQDVDGEMGKVIGAQDWEVEIDALNEAGGKTDLAGLFLEICLVMGAISLVMQGYKTKMKFMMLTIALGALGVIFMVWGIALYWPF
jgi:hypothetical protein